MSKVILHGMPDGTVRVTYPCEKPLLNEPEDTYLERIRIKTLAQRGDSDLVSSIRLDPIDASAIPYDYYIDALRHSNGVVSVDIAAARQILINMIRARRDTLLKESDSTKAKFDDIGTPQQQNKLKQYRQALRDYPTQVQSDIATLDLTGLRNYIAQFPVEPN